MWRFYGILIDITVKQQNNFIQMSVFDLTKWKAARENHKTFSIAAYLSF